MIALRRPSVRRVQWGFVDQAVSSFTNFAFGIVVARVAAPTEFGTFSLALTLYIILLWMSRSMTTEPFVVRFTAKSAGEQHTAARQALGAAAAIGFLAGMIVAAVGLGGSSLTTRVLGAMAVGMPGLLVQDAYRYVLFAEGRSSAAAANDLLWMVAEAAVIVGLFLTGHATTTTIVLAFGFGATLAACVGTWQTKVVPSLASSYRWLRDNRDLAGPFVLELLTVAGMIQAALLIVAAIAGPQALGALRAAMLLLGPLTVLFLGILVIGVPEGIRFRERSPKGLTRVVAGLGIAMPLVTVLWSLAIMLLPDRLGVDLLRSNWGPARRVLPAVGALTAGHSCALAAIIGLRVLGAAKRSLRARLWGAPIFLAGGILGSLLNGANGGAIGLSLAAWIDALVAWIAFRRALSAAAPIG